VAHDAVVTCLRRVIRQYEHQYPSGVVMNVVILNNRVDRVLDLNAGNIVVGFRVADYYVARLTYVHSRVGDSGGHATFDSHARATDRIDTVQTGAVDPQIAEHYVARVLGDYAIGYVVPDIKVLDYEVTPCSQHSVGKLLVAVQNRATNAARRISG